MAVYCLAIGQSRNHHKRDRQLKRDRLAQPSNYRQKPLGCNGNGNGNGNGSENL
ncbi:MAG: hypothetical protein AAGD25_36485 [Cyanobacteria bacterium P01_F01_bin.150]